MMKFLSRSVDKSDKKGAGTHAPVPYQSVITTPSIAIPGVVFAINRISFGRRMELSRLVREITRKAEFHAASKRDAVDCKYNAGYCNRWRCDDALVGHGSERTGALLV